MTYLKTLIMCGKQRATTLNYFQEFLYKGLNISDPEKLQLVGIHRLPQRLSYKEDTKINRPIIITLHSVDDKHWLFSRLKYLKLQRKRKILKQSESTSLNIYLNHIMSKKRSCYPYLRKCERKSKKQLGV